MCASALLPRGLLLREPCHLLYKIYARVANLAGLVVLNLAEGLPNQLFRDGCGNGTVKGQVADILQNHDHVIDEQLLTTVFKLRITHTSSCVCLNRSWSRVRSSVS